MGHDHRPGVKCPVCEAAKAKRLEPKQFGLLYFKHAVDHWLEEHSERISPKMLKDYGYMKAPLVAFFGEFPLTDIHIGHVDSYVDMRLQTPRTTYHFGAQRELDIPELNFNTVLVGPNSVRKEVSMLAQVMGRAGLWEAIAKDYNPPKLPKRKLGRVPEDSEIERLFVVACSNPRWFVAFWASMLQISTSCGVGEVVHLHVSDIDLVKRRITVRDGLKNEHRDRIIELNENGYVAAGQLLKRYYRICGDFQHKPNPEDYALPGRHRGVMGYDFTKPMGCWRTAWNQIRDKAGLPDLQMRHMRHIALTRLLENVDISERTITETAGHVSKEMWAAYSEVRRKPKQQAMKTLEFPIPQRNRAVETVDSVDIAANLLQTNTAKNS